MTGCVFCAIIRREEPASVLIRWPDAIAIMPRRPRVPGHTLVIPNVHVRDARTDPAVTSAAFARAAELAADNPAAFPELNLITSCGPAATQTVFHLHIHLLPRCEGDGLLLPWSNQ